MFRLVPAHIRPCHHALRQSIISIPELVVALFAKCWNPIRQIGPQWRMWWVMLGFNQLRCVMTFQSRSMSMWVQGQWGWRIWRMRDKNPVSDCHVCVSDILNFFFPGMGCFIALELFVKYLAHIFFKLLYSTTLPRHLFHIALSRSSPDLFHCESCANDYFHINCWKC